MNRNGKIVFWTSMVITFVLIVIILYQRTDVFKKILDEIVWFYNWLKGLGH